MKASGVYCSSLHHGAARARGELVRQDAEFREFYEANYGRMVAMVAAVLGDRDQAEDVAQEAFARALARWSRIGGYELPEAWVRRVALRIAIDSGRRLRRAVKVHIKLAAQRQVLALHYLADLPVEVIARECALPLGTVKVVGTIAAPVARSDFEWIAAASDDRTFVLADQSQALVIRFYILHLAANGKPGRLTLLNVPQLHGSQIYGMALTADASRLAVAWQNNPTGPVSSHISVTTLTTGATRTWTSAHGGALTVSWAGDITLAFNWQDTDGLARSGLRLLDTAAAGTDLLASRLLVPASTRTATLSSPGDPLVTADGSTLFATMASGDRTAIVSFSARSGKLEAVLTPVASAGQSPLYCGILWTDPHGRHLLTQCGTAQASIEGNRYTPIHLHELFPASFVGFANTFAW
jgi:RNA polymerase sigma-70 factor, ECF subfamily